MVLVDVVNEDERVVIDGKATRLRDLAKGLPFPPAQLNNPKIKEQKLSVSNQDYPTETKLDTPLDKLPSEIQRIQLWAQSQLVYQKTVGAELDWSPEELARMYANKGNPEYMLGDIPLIVLTKGDGGYADEPDVTGKQLEEERLKLQAELARLSSNSKHIIAKDNGHNIHLENPKLVIYSIREVIEAIHGRTRLDAAKQ